MGGDEASESSTLMYASSESPREDSGSQARRYEVAFEVLAEEEDRGRESAGSFCWMRAMKPGILSFDDGEGCT